jgi:hypothetical protein
MVLELVLAVAAFYGGTVTMLTKGRALAEAAPAGLSKVEMLLDVVLMDIILGAAAVAAWALYTDRSWARWMSVAAGAVVMGVLALRPGLVGKRSWIGALFALLGVLVILLALLLPGWT